jgi:hypothetical protein
MISMIYLHGLVIAASPSLGLGYRAIDIAHANQSRLSHAFSQ